MRKLPAYAALLCLTASYAQAADYGAYLASQFAASQGDLDQAAGRMERALQSEPGSLDLQKDAFGLALLAGRPDAVQLAASLPENPVAQLLLADAKARAGNWQGAELSYAELEHQGVMDTLRPVLLAWAQQAQGLTDRAIETLQAAIGTGKMSSFYLLHAALIADVGHRDGLASRLYDEVARANSGPNVRLAQILASWQARSGHPDQARATLLALQQASPDLGIATPGLLASMAQVQVGDPRVGIAEAYIGLAGALHAEEDSELPALMLQLGQAMAPELTEGRLVTAELAASRHQYRVGADALTHVSDRDPLTPLVQLHLANFEARIGQADRAEARLERLSSAYPDRPEPAMQLGDILAEQKKYPDAVAAYDRAIALVPHPQKTDWVMFYARGTTLQRAHDWPRAEADMKQALTLFPDQPFVLNFLGFSWTEQNHNLDLARQMIQRALDQRPNDGAIVDSLGWVVLRQGDVKDAVKLLEKAAEMVPDDPTITGHLGDAYWGAGRRVEAEDQWRRALVLGPDADEAARIETRLKSASAGK